MASYGATHRSPNEFLPESYGVTRATGQQPVVKIGGTPAAAALMKCAALIVACVFWASMALKRFFLR